MGFFVVDVVFVVVASAASSVAVSVASAASSVAVSVAAAAAVVIVVVAAAAVVFVVVAATVVAQMFQSISFSLDRLLQGSLDTLG